MGVALIFSGVAIALSLMALLHSIYATRAERGDRRAGLKLLEEQFSHDRERHAEQRRAELVAIEGSIHGGDQEDDHP